MTRTALNSTCGRPKAWEGESVFQTRCYRYCPPSYLKFKFFSEHFEGTKFSSIVSVLVALVWHIKMYLPPERMLPWLICSFTNYNSYSYGIATASCTIFQLE